MTITTLLATTVLTPMLVLGPPRLTVAAGAAGAPLTVTVEHSGEVEHAIVSVRAITRAGTGTRERAVTIVESRVPGPNQRAFLLTPPSAGAPQVLIVRAAHGTEADAPFVEALVRVDGGGAVIGIEYSQRKSLLGGSRFPPFDDEAVTGALRAMGAT